MSTLDTRRPHDRHRIGVPRRRPPPARAASKQLALVAMLFAVAMTFIDQTIVAIASPIDPGPARR